MMKIYSIALISIILFLGGCNQLQQDDGIVEKPADALSTSESCKKTRGFIVKGHEEEQQECQQP